METKIFNLHQTRSIAIISQTHQPSQNTSSPVGFFIILTFFGCVLGCVFTLKKCQKRRQELDEIVQELHKLEKMQDENLSIEQKLSPQMRQQIETLEKIWNQSP